MLSCFLIKNYFFGTKQDFDSNYIYYFQKCFGSNFHKKLKFITEPISKWNLLSLRFDPTINPNYNDKSLLCPGIKAANISNPIRKSIKIPDPTAEGPTKIHNETPEDFPIAFIFELSVCSGRTREESPFHRPEGLLNNSIALNPRIYLCEGRVSFCNFVALLYGRG